MQEQAEIPLLGSRARARARLISPELRRKSCSCRLRAALPTGSCRCVLRENAPERNVDAHFFYFLFFSCK